MPRGPKEWSPKKKNSRKGFRVELVQDVDRYPDFMARKGLTGFVVEDERELIRVLMDRPIHGAEQWGNEVHWQEDSLTDFKKDVRFLP